MHRVYDLKKSASGHDLLSVKIYRFRGDVPLVIRIYPDSRQTQIIPVFSHSPSMICDELRGVIDLLDHSHWRTMIQSLCLQKDTGAVGTAELFSDLY